MVGGAETLLQGYAEQLHQRGYEVEVLTTCTPSLGAWENTLEPGLAVVRGLPVHRFPIDSFSGPRYWELVGKLRSTGYLTYRHQQELLANSLNSSELCAYLRE